MGTVIIFGLISLLGGLAAVTSFKNKNIIGFLFAFGTFSVFGFFTVMTILHNGYPAA
ncbi:DUF2759 domain-containing protein [Bacillaceae bacterium Marseille-Q3522]|nr:DUF2759 domain-containing protein [Bacillaceae bacterium Marseille-Q3522]